MTSEPWKTVGTIASTAGVTTFAIGGAKSIAAVYRNFASPYTTLTESGRKLKRVRSRLQGLSPKRREEIDIAARSDSFNDSSLEILEGKLEILMDMHCRLSKRIEETTFTELRFPYSEFRDNLSTFENLARDLLNDTWKTTVPCIDDMKFKPENWKRTMERPSSSESTSAFMPEAISTESMSAFIPEAMESPSSSKSMLNLDIPMRANMRAIKGSFSSESREPFRIARESFPDPGDTPSRMV